MAAARDPAAIDWRSPAALLALLSIDGIGPVKTLAAVATDTAATLLGDEAPARLAAADALISAHRAGGIAVLGRFDGDYPERLGGLGDPPPVLFASGDLAALRVPLLAVIGTRAASDHGRAITADAVRIAGEAGAGIISGLARGIDGAAHRAALQRGAMTIAALPCGCANIYPPEHRRLAAELGAGAGLLLSEYPRTAAVTTARLSARNRLIVALSGAVIVAETGTDGGTMDAARRAYELGRPLFAAPGSAGAELLLTASPDELRSRSRQWRQLARRYRDASAPPARELDRVELARILSAQPTTDVG